MQPPVEDKEQLLRQVVSQFVAANDLEECAMTRSSIIVDHFIPIVALPSCGLYAPVSFHTLELVDLATKTRSPTHSSDPKSLGQHRRRRDVFTSSALIQKALKIERRWGRRKRNGSSRSGAFESELVKHDESSPQHSIEESDEGELENSIFVLSVALTYRTCNALIQALSMMNASLPSDCRIPDEVGGNHAHSRPAAGTISSWSYTLARQAEQFSTDVANSVSYWLGLTSTPSPPRAGTTPERSSVHPTTSTSESHLTTPSPSSINPASTRSRSAHRKPDKSTCIDMASGGQEASSEHHELFDLNELLKQRNNASETKASHAQRTSTSSEGFCTRDGKLFEKPDAESLSAFKHFQHTERTSDTKVKPTLRSNLTSSSGGSVPPSKPRKSPSMRSMHWLHLHRTKRSQNSLAPSISSNPSCSRFSECSETNSMHTAGEKESSSVTSHLRKAHSMRSDEEKDPNRRKHSSAASETTSIRRPDTSSQSLTEEESDQAFFLLVSVVSLFAHASTKGALCSVAELNVTDYDRDGEELRAKASALGTLERLFSIWLCNYMDSNPISYPCIVSRSDITSHIHLARGTSKAITKYTAVIPPIPLERGTHIYREIRSSGGLSLMTHHGLYVGGGDVIHFSGNEFALKALLFPDQRNTKLRRTSIMTFMKFGGTLMVEQYTHDDSIKMDDAQKALSTRVMAGRPSVEDLSRTTYHRSGILFPATGMLLRSGSKSWYTRALSNEGAALRAEFAYSYFHWARAKHQNKQNEEFDPELNRLFESFQGSFHFPPYNLFSNNCEHFCRWCKTGAGISLQVNFVGRALEAFFRGLTSSPGSRSTLHSRAEAKSPA